MLIPKIEVEYWESRPYESLDAKRRTDFEVTAWAINDILEEMEKMKDHGHKSIRLISGGMLLAFFSVFLPFALMAAFAAVAGISIFMGCVISLWE